MGRDAVGLGQEKKGKGGVGRMERGRSENKRRDGKKDGWMERDAQMEMPVVT